MSLEIIPLGNLVLAFIPLAIVIVIMGAWSLNPRDGLIAAARMMLQLTLIGYLLTFIFSTGSSLIVLGVLSVMLLVASWIALRPLDSWQLADFGRVLFALIIGGCTTLVLITAYVLEVEPWYAPRQVIPLAGMIFANSMNSISLAAERFGSELQRGTDILEARRLAYQTTLIPMLNTLLAVGLVALPGMMTGQILSGASPLIAVRYQIMVMCMLGGASGISAAVYLWLVIRHKTRNSQPIN